MAEQGHGHHGHGGQMTPEQQMQMIQQEIRLAKNLGQIKYKIIVMSGKGGVGKSTVSANLAISLAAKGYKVALVDADIYGPSIPKIFNIEKEKIGLIDDLMQPVKKYGVAINSIGFMIDAKQAVIWRGPLAANTMLQLFTNTNWEDIDYMIVDFPPGTGDIQLSIMQQLVIDASIIVTTPQTLSVNDARKGADMFSPDKLNVPILGIVENMSWFTPQEHLDEKYYIFGQGGGQTLAEELNTQVLAQIPLIKEVGISAEEGSNLIEKNIPEINTVFQQIADALTKALPL